jgi:hypothetical protein
MHAEIDPCCDLVELPLNKMLNNLIVIVTTYAFSACYVMENL